MNVSRKLSSILLVTLVISAMFTLGGCRQAPAPRVLKLAQLEISGYGVMEVPEGVKVIHRNWVVPENRIVLTFNRELDPEQEVELFLFDIGNIRVVYPYKSTAEHKYFCYRIEGRTLTISPADKESGGLPTFFVTLVLPAELRALDGTPLQEDTFVWLCTQRPTPQSLAMKHREGLEEDSPLILPVWGRDDGRSIAYLLENSLLYAKPSAAAETVAELGSAENVRVLSKKGEWAEVMVYYPKYHFHEPALDRLASDFDVWTSDLVRRVRGYLPLRLLQPILRPRNKSSFVTVYPHYTGYYDDIRKTGMKVSAPPAATGSVSLMPGGILTQERLDFLEGLALGGSGYLTAGGSWGATYGRAGVIGHLSLHDPYVHHLSLTWTPAQYNRYLGIRKAYVARLESYWDAHLVAPVYSAWKERLRAFFRRAVRKQDVWMAWGAEDKDLRVETFARKTADAFGETSAEKDRIFALITQQPTLDLNEGWLEVINYFVLPVFRDRDRDFWGEVQSKREEMFRE